MCGWKEGNRAQLQPHHTTPLHSTPLHSTPHTTPHHTTLHSTPLHSTQGHTTEPRHTKKKKHTLHQPPPATPHHTTHHHTPHHTHTHIHTHTTLHQTTEAIKWRYFKALYKTSEIPCNFIAPILLMCKKNGLTFNYIFANGKRTTWIKYLIFGEILKDNRFFQMLFPSPFWVSRPYHRGF